MNYSVYILYSKEYDKYYIGQTNNLDNRVIRHNNGYVKSTKGFKPWDLVYSESYSTRSEAMNRERYLKSLKSLKSKKAIKELVEAFR